MTEQELIQRLGKIERLFAGATLQGERDAAASAIERVRAKLKEFERKEKPLEFKFSMGDGWNRKLFVALLRRYGIEPYRYPRQRYTTVMARMPKSFLDETLWPEFEELSEVLTKYISDITDKVIREHIYEDSSEAGVVAEPRQLGG